MIERPGSGGSHDGSDSVVERCGVSERDREGHDKAAQMTTNRTNYFLLVFGEYHIGMAGDACRVPVSPGLKYLETLLRYSRGVTCFARTPANRPNGEIGSIELLHLADRTNPSDFTETDEGARWRKSGGIWRAGVNPEVAAHDDDDDRTGKGDEKENRGYAIRQRPEEMISRDAAARFRRHRKTLLARAEMASEAEAKSLRDESDQIEKYLRVTTFCSRPKFEPTDEDRAHDTIAAGIKSAIASISAQKKAIGEHFRKAVRKSGTAWQYIGELEWDTAPCGALEDPTTVEEDVPCERGEMETLPSGEWKISLGGETCVVPDSVGMGCIAALLRLSWRRVPAASLRSALSTGRDVETLTGRMERVLRGLIPKEARQRMTEELWEMDDRELADYENCEASMRGERRPSAVRYLRLPAATLARIATTLDPATGAWLATITNPYAFVHAVRQIESLKATLFPPPVRDPRSDRRIWGDGTVKGRKDAVAAVRAIRAQQKAVRKEDDRARSLVSHNIDAALSAISLRNQKIGQSLRENIETGRELIYTGEIDWSVSH